MNQPAQTAAPVAPDYRGQSQLDDIVASLLADDRIDMRSDNRITSGSGFVELVIHLAAETGWGQGDVLLSLHHDHKLHRTVIDTSCSDPYQRGYIWWILAVVLRELAGWDIERVRADGTLGGRDSGDDAAQLAVGAPNINDYLAAREAFCTSVVETIPGYADIELEELLSDGHIDHRIFDRYPRLLSWLYAIADGNVDLPVVDLNHPARQYDLHLKEPNQ